MSYPLYSAAVEPINGVATGYTGTSYATMTDTATMGYADNNVESTGMVSDAPALVGDGSALVGDASGLVGDGSALVGDAPATGMVDPCSAGPAYWCSSADTFQQCVQSHGYTGSLDTFSACQVKKEKEECKYQAYYCANEQNFKECVPGGDMQAMCNSDECSRGPAFWCSTDENFSKCVQSKGYTGKRASFAACKPYVPDRCAAGITYWCASKEKYAECGVSSKSFEEVCQVPMQQCPRVCQETCPKCGESL